MKIKKLLKKYTAEEVAKTVIKNYPEQKNSYEGYIKVYNELLQLTPSKTDFECGLSYVIDKWDDNIEAEEYFSVSGISDSSKKCVYTGRSGSEITWSLMMTPWDNWLNMKVNIKESANDKLPKDEYKKYKHYLSHVLWEMTFCGFDYENTIEEKQELDDICDRIDRGEEELVDWEDIKDELTERLNSDE